MKKALFRFTEYLLQKITTPKTFLNRMALAKVINIADKRLFEWRRIYLTEFLSFEDKILPLPRVVDVGVVEGCSITPSIRKDGVDLVQMKDEIKVNSTFVKKVNLMLRGMCPTELDYDSQVCYGDVWDHLTYGLMVATVAAELGSRAGLPGTISIERLKLLVKEPPSRSISNPASVGPFQIYKSNWSISLSNIPDLPHESYYVHAAHFFRIAIYAHDMVMKAWKKVGVPFSDKDPKWLLDLYAKRDLLAYCLLWRRYYNGAGSYFNIPDPNNPGRYLDGNVMCMRNLAFGLTAIGVMRNRDRFLKLYPVSKRDLSDPELNDIWTKSQNFQS